MRNSDIRARLRRGSDNLWNARCPAFGHASTMVVRHALQRVIWPFSLVPTDLQPADVRVDVSRRGGREERYKIYVIGQCHRDGGAVRVPLPRSTATDCTIEDCSSDGCAEAAIGTRSRAITARRLLLRVTLLAVSQELDTVVRLCSVESPKTRAAHLCTPCRFPAAQRIRAIEASTVPHWEDLRRGTSGTIVRRRGDHLSRMRQ